MENKKLTTKKILLIILLVILILLGVFWISCGGFWTLIGLSWNDYKSILNISLPSLIIGVLFVYLWSKWIKNKDILDWRQENLLLIFLFILIILGLFIWNFLWSYDRSILNGSLPFFIIIGILFTYILYKVRNKDILYWFFLPTFTFLCLLIVFLIYLVLL